MSTQPVETQPRLLPGVIAKCARLGIPVQVVLELTYRCNLRCAHCYVDLDETDELTLEEWKDVLHQLKAAGTIYLLLTGGEIMVRADFLDIATYARQDGFILGMLTNCSLVTPAISQAIAELRPFSIATSLYGATASTHESVTKVPGSFQRTLEGIKLLVGAGLVPTVQVMVMKTNTRELPQIQKLVNSLGAVARIDIGMAPSKTGADIPFRYEPGVAELVGCGWQPEIPDLTEGHGLQLCKAGKAMCSISPRGDVFPCIMFPLKLGNLRKSSFSSIWQLEPCAELRYLRSMRRSDLYGCNQCELSAYCQRCTGIAYIESGRADSPSPSACRQAQTRWRLTQAVEVRS
ncbi:radical SAM/SPASM domain-containing protein [Chloroflexota bacterium]